MQVAIGNNSVFWPDYTAGITISAFPYTAEYDGWLTASVIGDQGTGQNGYLQINGNTVVHSYGLDYTTSQWVIPVSRGDVITAHQVGSVTIFPCKGGR